MTRRFTKMTVVLAVVALCCFMFAGMAAAAGQFSFTTESNPIDGSATNYVKADHTYNFDINVTGITAPVEQFTSNVINEESENKLLLTFPKGFCSNYSFDASSVSVYLTINGEEYGPIQVLPEFVMDETDVAEGCGCSVAEQVYFNIERQGLPVDLANPAYVTGVRIEGFEVVTPLEPGQYQICVTHTQTSCGIDACANLNVVKTVGEITLDTINTECLYAGGQVTICGEILDTCGDPWNDTTWPVIVELKEKVTDLKCGENCYTYNDIMIADEENYGENCFGADTCIEEGTGSPLWAQVVHVMTDGSGRFCATLDLPTWLNTKNNVEYVLIARTPEVRDEKAAFDSPIEWKFGDQPESRVPAESIEDLNMKDQSMHVKRGPYTLMLESQMGPYTTKAHAWLKSADYYLPEIQPGNPYFIVSSNLGTQIDVAQRYPVTIKLVDKFCNPTTNAIACGAPLAPLKVELVAYDCDNPTQVAGKFYDEAGNEIVYTQIPSGADSVIVYFQATKTGKVTLKESALFGATDAHQSITGQCCLEVNSSAGCVLEVTNLVTGEFCDPTEMFPIPVGYNGDYEFPKAGWPVKVSLHYPPTANIRVELLGWDYKNDAWQILPASEATWDLVAKTDADPDTGAPAYLSYNADGDYVSGDTFVHNTGVPYNTSKSDFYVYFNNTCDYSLVEKGLSQSPFKQFAVKIVDIDNNVYQIESLDPFIPSADMVRILEPQKWQILSTPKTLTGDGDMKTLLPGSGIVPYTEILTYKDNGWVQVLPTDQLEPLYAYLLNMRQNTCAPDECNSGDCYEQKNVYAKYVFARAVDPAYAMPATRLLSAGANLIGPAFNEHEINPISLANDLIGIGEMSKEEECFLYDFGCCDCHDCDIVTLCEYTDGGPYQTMDEYGELICPNLLFQSNTLAMLSATFCDGCTAILNYGGDGANLCRNSKGNLAEFTSAALGGSNVQSWLQDPLYYAWNGDGYLAYLTKAQTMTGTAQLELVNVFNTELYGE